jgi:hypothetical protein
MNPTEPLPAHPTPPQYPAEGYATPGYPAQGYPATGGPYGGYGYVAPAPPMNGLAIASMVMAILGFGPIAAIMGHIARNQIKERGEQGDGFALAGIIVGWVYTGLWFVLCCGILAFGGGLSIFTNT